MMFGGLQQGGFVEGGFPTGYGFRNREEAERFASLCMEHRRQGRDPSEPVHVTGKWMSAEWGVTSATVGRTMQRLNDLNLVQSAYRGNHSKGSAYYVSDPEGFLRVWEGTGGSGGAGQAQGGLPGFDDNNDSLGGGGTDSGDDPWRYEH